jgi:hypothetical protein
MAEYSINQQGLQQFTSLELIARQVVEGFITGLHKSPFLDFFVEFPVETQAIQYGESTSTSTGAYRPYRTALCEAIRRRDQSPQPYYFGCQLFHVFPPRRSSSDTPTRHFAFMVQQYDVSA